MGDVSEFFKSGFLSVHKNAMGRNYQQKTLNDRMNNFNNMRRETRHTLIFQKRQIKENMTPINTPEPTKLVKKVVEKKEVQKPIKRLEMLSKWKAEKEKRKQEEQKKAKPLFKFCRIPVEIGLPNLENVNKEIKGKPIKSNPTPIKSQFAPPNHKFRAPKNIKPININYRCNDTSSLHKTTLESQKINSSKANKVNTKQTLIVSPKKTRSVTSRNNQKGELNEKLSNIPSKKSQIKTEINKINPGQNKYLKEKTVPVNPKVEDKNKFKAKIKEPVQKSTSNINTRKKLQFKDSSVIENNTSRTIKGSSPKKNTKDKKTTNKTRLLVDLTSPGLEFNSKNKEKYKRNESKELKVSNSIEIKKTPKEKNEFEEVPSSKDATLNNKRKRLKMLKQQKLNESNTMSTFNNCGEPADVTPKKGVGWNVIEIVDSDDEVFSKAINNKNPRRITRTYKKTPRKAPNPNIIEDSTIDETLTNEINEERHLCSTSKTDKNDNKTRIKNKSLKKHEDEGEAKETIINNKAKSSSSTIESATGSASPDYPVECVSPTNESLNTSSHTPAKNVAPENFPVYISPFVTVSRGKSSARKEYQVRRSAGACISGSPELNKDISDNISPKAGANYFTRKLNNEIARIDDMCDEWSKYKDNNDCPEEANDMIDVAIGQSKLLISKKFQQFRDLIDQCKNCQYKEKAVTCEDLHGFWDMIYMQVEDLNKRFSSLDVLKSNNWQEVVPEKKPVIKRGRGRPKKIAVSSSLKNIIKAARNMKKSGGDEVNVAMIGDESSTFKPPIKDRVIRTPRRSSSTRNSLRVSLLSNQAKNRLSSPGLTMMKISQAIKCGDGLTPSLTPSKSILKTDLTKSANRITKSVLFKDDLENNIEKCVKPVKTSLFANVEDSGNKENDSNEINLISFSPTTPTRRSRRLSKIN